MHISIIDDEKILTSKISKKLQLNGYWVNEFYSYSDFINNWIQDNISDLYIIDLSLWDWSGFDIIQILRKQKKISTPIIIISWFWDSQNIVFWLDLWADDYLTKPFSPDVLLAKIKAILRRPANIDEIKDLIYNNIILKLASKEVFLNWELVELNKKESLIVELFLSNRWKLIEKEKMIKYIWWAQSTIDVKDNTINVTLSKLRKKLWENFPIQTKINIWYILE